MSEYKPNPERHILRPYQDALVTAAAKRRLGDAFSTCYLCIPPAGGKTDTAVEIAVREFLALGRKVLWVAWDWVLLDQAVDTLNKRYLVATNRIGFAISSPPQGIPFVRGDRYANLSRDSKAGAKIDILFTTPRVFVNNLSHFKGFKPSLIIHDEAHWGIGGVTEQEFRKYYKKRQISVLGLSGTPKRRRDWDRIEPLVSFNGLVRNNYLAEPILASIKSNRTYDLKMGGPDEFGRGGRMISPDTIRELTEDRERNRVIVDYVKRHAIRLGKTIIFAGNKAHADILGAMLGSWGAVVIHEGSDDPRGLIKEFKSGHHRIAICVNMLKQGIDIPDVNSIIITVPTTSDIAYFQMACRGARILHYKSTFNLIDVTDTFNNANFSKLLVHGIDFFSGASGRGDWEVQETTYLGRFAGTSRRSIQNNSSRTHDYKPVTSTFEMKYTEHDPIYLQRLSGLRINRHQTFGVECELTHQKDSFEFEKRSLWEPIAITLLDSIRKIVESRNCAKIPLFTKTEVNDIDYGKWNVVFDASCGWEIVSPILSGVEGFEDLAQLFHHLEASDTLKNLSLKVDYSTGLHVHLGWNYGNIAQTKRLVKAVRKFSPALYTLVAPSRLGNDHCRPVKDFLSQSKMAGINSMTDFKNEWRDHDSRYHDVNFQGVKRDDPTVEIRLGSGTYDGYKIALWISLWMNLFYAVDRPVDPLSVSDEGTGRSIKIEEDEDSDIVQICVKYLGILPNVTSSSGRPDFSDFLQKLYQRRLELFGNEYWRKKLGSNVVTSLLEYWNQEYRKVRSK